MPQTIAAVLAQGNVTLRELETYYSVEDLYVLMEVAAVREYNSYLVNREQTRRNEAR